MEANLFTALWVPSRFLGAVDYNLPVARANLVVVELKFGGFRERFRASVVGPEPESRELDEALDQYARRMREEYAPGGAEVLTPDAAELDDDQGE